MITLSEEVQVEFTEDRTEGIWISYHRFVSAPSSVKRSRYSGASGGLWQNRLEETAVIHLVRLGKDAVAGSERIDQGDFLRVGSKNPHRPALGEAG